MKNFRQLGIYMDHTHAFLMELEADQIISRDIVSEWKDTDKKSYQNFHFFGFNCSEKKQLQKAYFSEISDIIRNYNQVVLFGPTDAKNELHKLLSGNHLFKEIKIEFVDTDKLSNEQMHEFVKEYYK